MKFHLNAVLAGSLLAANASAFSFQAPSNRVNGVSLRYTRVEGVVDIGEYTQRDVYSMQEWATNAGVQTADGFEITSYDGQDFYAMTQQNIPAGSPVLFVPEGMIFTATKAGQELGQYLSQGEGELARANLQEKVPLFRLFVKVLIEYEKGQESPWYSWLNSLPRLFNTGAAMTYACFECLPPYAGWLAMSERINFVNFQKAVQYVSCIDPNILNDKGILKWAYNVAVTRSVNRNGERLIAPMADMFNHGTETEVEITYDNDGNCMVYASKDIPAGSPLRMSLGDPTNPTPLFATYGFLDESSPATFCKTMHLRPEMEELGYDFKDLLFYKDTGDISMEVYDVFLYSVLAQDPNLKQGFYQAVMSGDEATKNQYHEQYWSYTVEAMRNHVDSTLRELDQLSAQAQSKDPQTHPRVPVILQHNSYVGKHF